MISEFIKSIYEYKPEESYILIWLKKDPKTHISRFFTDIDKAAGYVTKNNDDAYLMSGLSPENFGINRRCSQDQISGIPGLIADIDIKTPGHKKKNLPSTIEQAVGLVLGHGFDPTLIVKTGGGIHAWWLFKEMWMFETDDERAKARALREKMNLVVAARAAKFEWSVDSVFNLDRVLRIPGTKNCKYDPKFDVVLTKSDGPRYDPGDFEEFDEFSACVSAFPHKAGAKGRGSGVSASDAYVKARGLVFNENAKPPFEQFNDAKAIFDPVWTDTWTKTREPSEFRNNDNSQSSYDFAMAIFMAKANWSDQDMVDTLIYYRKKHGEYEKRRDDNRYFTTTILNARKRVEQEMSEDELDDYETYRDVVEYAEITDSQRKKNLKDISANLGVNVLKIIKWIEEDPSYTIKLDSGYVNLPDVDCLYTQVKLRKHIARVTNRLINKVPSKKWEKLSVLIMDSIVEEEVSDDSTLEGRFKSWLGQYLENAAIQTAVDSVNSQAPFLHTDGFWYINATKFHEWAELYAGLKGEKIQKTRRDLRKFIGEPGSKVTVRIDGQVRSIYAWKVPKKVNVAYIRVEKKILKPVINKCTTYTTSNNVVKF